MEAETTFAIMSLPAGSARPPLAVWDNRSQIPAVLQDQSVSNSLLELQTTRHVDTSAPTQLTPQMLKQSEELANKLTKPAEVAR